MLIKVVKDIFEVSDHYTGLLKMKIRCRWEYGRSNDRKKMSKMQASKRMDRKEARDEYKRNGSETRITIGYRKDRNRKKENK